MKPYEFILCVNKILDEIKPTTNQWYIPPDAFKPILVELEQELKSHNASSSKEDLKLGSQLLHALFIAAVVGKLLQSAKEIREAHREATVPFRVLLLNQAALQIMNFMDIFYKSTTFVNLYNDCCYQLSQSLNEQMILAEACYNTSDSPDPAHYAQQIIMLADAALAAINGAIAPLPQDLAHSSSTRELLGTLLDGSLEFIIVENACKQLDKPVNVISQSIAAIASNPSRSPIPQQWAAVMENIFEFTRLHLKRLHDAYLGGKTTLSESDAITLCELHTHYSDNLRQWRAQIKAVSRDAAQNPPAHLLAQFSVAKSTPAPPQPAPIPDRVVVGAPSTCAELC